MGGWGGKGWEAAGQRGGGEGEGRGIHGHVIFSHGRHRSESVLLRIPPARDPRVPFCPDQLRPLPYLPGPPVAEHMAVIGLRRPAPALQLARTWPLLPMMAPRPHAVRGVRVVRLQGAAAAAAASSGADPGGVGLDLNCRFRDRLGAWIRWKAHVMHGMSRTDTHDVHVP